MYTSYIIIKKYRILIIPLSFPIIITLQLTCYLFDKIICLGFHDGSWLTKISWSSVNDDERTGVIMVDLVRNPDAPEDKNTVVIPEDIEREFNHGHSTCK